MPRRSLIVVVLFCLLSFIVACGTEPTPTPPPPTRRPTRTPIPAATLPKPTQTIPTVVPLATNTEEASPTTAATIAAPKNPPQNNSSGGGLTVWTLAPLVSYFKKLDPSNQAPIARAPNVNPLTGLEVSDPSALQRRPVMARIGNDPSARPIHTGFNQADLVFEEMIDQKGMVFAVTRFSLIFYGQGGAFRPLRSARAVNASLMPMFDAILVSSGGSDGTRFMLSQLPWKDRTVDGDLQNSAICISSGDWRTRVVSTVDHVQQFMTAKGQEAPVNLRGFQFSASAPGGSPAASFLFDHSPWPFRAAGVIEWRNDPASGKYLRFVNGEPHNTQQYALDGAWGKTCALGNPAVEQIAASNVVVLNAKYEPTDFVEDTLNSYSAFVELTGSGTAQIFRDGVKIDARWVRPSLTSFIQLTDANGSELALKPGNTWFEIAPLGYMPTVK